MLLKFINPIAVLFQEGGYSTSVTLALTIMVTIMAIASSFLKKKNKKNSLSDPADPVPRLPLLPPVGPTFSEYFAAQQEGRLIESQPVWVQAYGPIFTIPSPLKGIVSDFVAVADPTLTKELCIVQANQYRPPSRFTTRGPKFAAATRTSVGASLAGTTGDEWKWRRAAFLKEMHKSKLFSLDRQLLTTIANAGERLCDKLQEAAVSNQLVKVDILATEAAFDTILFFLFGKILEGYDANEVRQAAKDTLAYLFAYLSDPLFFLFQNIPGTTASQVRQKRNAAWKVYDSLVQDEIIQMIKEANQEVPRDTQRLPGSILESWFASEPKFSNRGLGPILAEVRGMVIAGFETTAHALAYSFGMMAQHKALASELHDVAKKALHNSGGDMQAAMEKSAVVKNFFMEALRLYPLAPMLAGVCTDDIVLSFEDKQYSLPNGTNCLFLSYVMQRHVDYCKGTKGPHEVEPERWNATKIQDQPFLHTFNNGPHSCPGKPLSILEGHIFLLQVASRFEFTFPEGVDRVLCEEQLLSRPKNAMPLYVTVTMKKQH